MIATLRNQRFRRRLVQTLALIAVAAVVISMALTAQTNLAAQGMATGFDFLRRSTGWEIQFSLIPYSSRDTYLRALTVGLLNTVFVGVLSLFLATWIGLVVGVARTSVNLVANVIGTVYVEIFRNIPLVLQVFFWYGVLTHMPGPRDAYHLAGVYLSNRGLHLPTVNVDAAGLALVAAALLAAVVTLRILFRSRTAGASALRYAVVTGVLLLPVLALLALPERNGDVPLIDQPVLQGLRFRGGLTVRPEFTALLISIALFGGAYIGEIVRGGLLSVPRHQIESAHALGMRPWQVYRLVHLPLALRSILPPLGNQYVWLMKATTMGVAIGFSDFFMIVSTSINQSGQALELIAIMMAGFLAINMTISRLMGAANRALALPGREGES
jgi:His/Glu/Gln/Arg/opine family amino acid ABC transporter permease subunit